MRENYRFTYLPLHITFTSSLSDASLLSPRHHSHIDEAADHLFKLDAILLLRLLRLPFSTVDECFTMSSSISPQSRPSSETTK